MFAENSLKFSEKTNKKYSLLSPLLTREDLSLARGSLNIRATTIVYISNMYIWAGTGRFSLGQGTHSHQRALRMQKALGHAAQQALQSKSKLWARITQCLWVNSHQVVFDGTFADKPYQGHIYLRNFLQDTETQNQHHHINQSMALSLSLDTSLTQQQFLFLLLPCFICLIWEFEI